MKHTFKGPFLAFASVASVRHSYVTSAYKAAALALGAVVLFGCPVYSGNQTDVVCDSQGNCCDESTGNCSSWSCDYSAQCPYGASCYQGYCSSASYDGGGYYDAGDAGDADASFSDASDATVDCSTTGCQPGFVCTLTNGVALCLASDAGDGSIGPGTDGGTDAKSTGSDSGSHDAGVDAPTFPPFTGCQNDNACVADSGAGARCLNGKCVAAANECSDSTQCPIVGSAQEQCVQGVCTPACATTGTACPAGYSCNTSGSESVCTGNPTPCGAAAGAAACATGTTCVDEHCVPLCNTGAGDAGPACAGGLVCVDHGCIPSQTPQFVCAGSDGEQSSCASGSVCLHHNCYIACTLQDAGAADAGNSCRTAGNFNVCKPVTTSTGTYDVCGSATNLGNECDPTQGIACSNSRICIDGTCY